MMTDLRSSDLTEYPDPDSPDPCLGSVYIWRPFIPPSTGSGHKSQWCFVQKYLSSNVLGNLSFFHLKGHLQMIDMYVFTCYFGRWNEQWAAHFTSAVTLWWIWSRVLSRPSPAWLGSWGGAGQVTCIYRPVSACHTGHYCSCNNVTSLELHH